MEVVETPAPAQVPPPEPISAVDAAVASGDQSAFREARHAERSGKPLPTVEPTPEPAAEPKVDVVPEVKAVSKRQEQINTYERRIAEQDQRIRALEAQISPSAALRSEPAPANEPEYKRFRAMPEAPKLADFDSLEDHAAAMSHFIAKTMLAEDRAATAERTQHESIATAHETRLKAFESRMDAVKAKDPEFVTRVSPITSQLLPTANARAQGLPVGPLNTVADEVIDSEHAAELIAHFADHPDEFDAFKTCRNPQEVTRRLARLEATLTAPKPPVLKTETSAPKPPTFLGNKAADPVDAIDAAVASGDQGAFKAARLAKRAAAQR